jgi:putative membrane protein
MTMCGMTSRWHTGWILMPAATVIFLALLIAGLVLAARYLNSSSRGSGANATVGLPGGAEEVLAQRYARGEIDDDEYQRRFETLHQGG